MLQRHLSILHKTPLIVGILIAGKNVFYSMVQPLFFNFLSRNSLGYLEGKVL